MLTTIKTKFISLKVNKS